MSPNARMAFHFIRCGFAIGFPFGFVGGVAVYAIARLAVQ